MRTSRSAGCRVIVKGVVLAALLLTCGAALAGLGNADSAKTREPSIPALVTPSGSAVEPATTGSSSTSPPPAAGAERLSMYVAPEPVASPSAVSAPPPITSVQQFGAERSLSNDDFDYDALPGRLSDLGLRRLWSEGLDLERQELLLDSARRYELIVGEVPEESYTYWRIARNYWRYGESLPTESVDQRLHYFELAESWAGRGISIDPDCAPCMLWKFVAMGRQATTKGLLSAVGDVREMQRLLRRGIELKPDHADNEGNATLGNLYYAGAVFYRVIPDWFWLRWFLGVRGDKERSLEYARKAVDLAQVRVDYRVELGAALLCLGVDDDRSEAIAEGVEILEAARQLPPYLSTDHLDRAHAAILIESPEKACGYSRDGFIDMDAVLEESGAKH